MTTHANARGNSTDRKRRRAWILWYFGNGKTAPCWECKTRVDMQTMVVDRIIPGGSYRRNNIRPHCWECSTRQGYRLGVGAA